MACSTTAAEVFRAVLAAIRRYVSPPSYPVGDQSIVMEIPISRERWEVNVYVDICEQLAAKGCCLQTVKPSFLYTRARTVGDIVELIRGDLGDCPEMAERMVATRGKKAKAKGAKKEG